MDARKAAIKNLIMAAAVVVGMAPMVVMRKPKALKVVEPLAHQIGVHLVLAVAAALVVDLGMI